MDTTVEGHRKMFEGDSAEMCGGKFQLMSMGGRAEVLTCADLGAKSPISLTKNSTAFLFEWWLLVISTVGLSLEHDL